MTQQTQIDPSLLNQIRAIVGDDHATDDPSRCDLATSDVFSRNRQTPALMVVAPKSTDETSAVVRLLGEHGVPVIARGAGLSYTGSFAIDRPVVIIDMSRMNAVQANVADRYAVAGAGASWAQVADVLRPLGMAATQISPISGAFATVGGLASQGIPAGPDGILGVTVVLADGSVVQTGAPAHFHRYAGADVTGLFLGDCGAFGIKTEVVLRIAPEQPATFASFGFNDVDELLQSLMTCMGDRIVTRAFAMDRVKSADAAKVGIGEAVRTAASVIRRSETLMQSAKDAAKLLRFAATGPDEKPWSLHLTIESPTKAGADAQLERACGICQVHGQRGDDVFPRAMRAKPYSVRGFIGPVGERWAPVHGIFALSRVRAAMADLQAFVASHASQMQELGVSTSYLISSAGFYIVIEPMMYWADQLDPLHMQYLSARNRERFGSFPPNPAGRELVLTMRSGMRDIMDRHGAVHSQIGRFYRLGGQGIPENLMPRLKAALDPKHGINPGVLGLPVDDKSNAK
ncbi:FAD-binding oxidoreductase [Rhodoplanes sp. Z2-YC6860]|uniref:FAD-binding oxidoreductase n=1 Tax=Rhodoplanes sp. Z2-YC6860 TaxID=674703 RepID=UPI00078D3CB6|nr:FAD-binding oxidoreductase [Rhodoplanes sp. Z2-YC6860]AMN44033.1 FAD/FMN-dependent dehydrogenase [Rhodoplanes sp. Z2-YC6860]